MPPINCAIGRIAQSAASITMAKKLVILCTHGREDPERAANSLVMTTAAHASNVDVIMGFQANVVTLASKGAAEPVEDLYFG